MRKENWTDEQDVITYKDLFLSFVQTVYFRKLEISQKPGEHAALYLEAVLDSDLSENDFHAIPQTITVMYRKNGEDKPLFYGVLDTVHIDKDGAESVLRIEAWDATRLLDTDRKSRTFQNPQMTVRQLTDEIMKPYPGADYKIHIPDVPIGQLITQYEETDWEFLKRFFSKYHETLYPDPAFDAVRWQTGGSSVPEVWNWDMLPFELKQDFMDLNARRENGFESLTCAQNVGYYVETYDIATLGNQIFYKGTEWAVASLERTLKNGLLLNSYCLKKKEGLRVLSYYNPRITGISIDGTVKAVSRDKVQVNMGLDAGGGDNGYWFPFSTVASSSDGSGWYCMPEAGESIRVYFPVDDEKEAYVITSIKGHEPEAGNSADPMGNPNVRSIQTEQGNQVQFTEEGVVIAAGEGQGSIILGKSGEVVLDAVKDLTLSAGEAINIVASNKVILSSQTSVKIASLTGSDVELKKGEISLHGQLINEN